MIDLALLQATLDAHLPAHIERQRWSGAAEGGVAVAQPVWIERVGDQPLLAWMVVEVTLARGCQPALPAVHRGPAGAPMARVPRRQGA